jgi:hypothetical protein
MEGALMLLRIAVMALGLGSASQALAADNKPPPQREICRQSTPVIRDLWSNGAYDAPADVAALMLDAIDGKLPDVRRHLEAMKPADASRWRQLAMLTATWTGQSAVVDGMLDDGASVDAQATIPPLKADFFDHTVDAMDHDSRFGGSTGVKNLMAAGLVRNRGQPTGPALTVAAECGDLATLQVLLRHHADVSQREMQNGANALSVATVGGDAPVVALLLDNGADPCAFDRHAAEFHRKHPARQTPVLAQIGSRAKLPAALVARLNCPAVAVTH